jgi:hypothetical protein
MVFRAINVFNFASVVIVIQCFVKTGVPWGQKWFQGLLTAKK